MNLRFWSEQRELRAIALLLLALDRKVNTIMSQLDELSRDESALEAAFAQLTHDLSVGLTDLHAQIAGLQGDPTVVGQIGDRINALIGQVQQADASVKAADPGPQSEPEPTFPDQPDGPLPDETADPAAPESPEAPAAAPAPVTEPEDVADPVVPTFPADAPADSSDDLETDPVADGGTPTDPDVDPLAPVDTTAPSADPNEQTSVGAPPVADPEDPTPDPSV